MKPTLHFLKLVLKIKYTQVKLYILGLSEARKRCINVILTVILKWNTKEKLDHRHQRAGGPPTAYDSNILFTNNKSEQSFAAHYPDFPTNSEVSLLFRAIKW